MIYTISKTIINVQKIKLYIKKLSPLWLSPTTPLPISILQCMTSTTLTGGSELSLMSNLYSGTSCIRTTTTDTQSNNGWTETMHCKGKFQNI